MKQKVIKYLIVSLLLVVCWSPEAPPSVAAQDDLPPGRRLSRPMVKGKEPVRDVKREEAVFTLLESSTERIRVRFHLPPAEIEKDAGGGFSSIVAGGGNPGSGSTLDPGFPALPTFTTRVAIPPEAQVRVSFSHGPTTDLGPERLLPTPLITGRDEMGVPLYDFSYADSFLVGDTYPEVPYTTDGPGYLRRQRALSVTVYPFTVNPEDMMCSYFGEATIEISLTGGASSGDSPVIGKDYFSNVYRKAVINPDDSERWLKRREPSGPKLSVFNTGLDWVKITVREEGMYRITYHDLFELGVEPAMIDPTGFQMFYLGGLEVPEDVTVERPELEEIAVRVSDGGDGSFDSGDMIMFYGQSLSRWLDADEFHSHRYTDENAYWLTWGNPGAVPLRMEVENVSPGGTATPVSSVRNRSHFEQNSVYASDEEEGYASVPDDWIWEEISGTPGVEEEANFEFNMTDLSGQGTDSIRVEIYGVPKFTSHKVWLSINGRMFDEIRFSSRFAFRTDWIQLLASDLREGTNTLTVTLPKDESSVEEDAIYFGWFELSTLNSLVGPGSGYVFEGNTGGDEFEYDLTVSNLSNPLLYAISDPFSPVELSGFSLVNDDLRFDDTGRTPPARYLVLDRSNLKLPTSISLKTGTDLRENGKGADYLIITHPDLLSQAQRLAEFRREENGFMVEVVTTNDLYEEFSGGLKDVTAIRDFILWTYENWNPAPAWVVLFGDGHLDFKEYTTFGKNKPNMVLPHVDRDLAIDDWFVRLDAGNDPDMFYGRLTVQNTEQAKVAVDKIINYERNPEYGPWRSRVIIVADDCFRNRNCETLPHTRQSEEVDARISPEFKRVKIYLLDYPYDPPETGLYKPAAAARLIEEWNRGAILINYVGHGSHNRWAHEKVFYGPSHLSLLRNRTRLPIVIAASCSIGHFDHFLYDGMVEDLLVMPGGGAIASFAATRVTYSDPNEMINNAFVENLFTDPNTKPYLGEAAVLAKIEVGGGNASRYTLFGDPATRLAFPDLPVQTLEAPDSLAPLGTAGYTGEVRRDGVRDDTFDGYAQVDVYSPPSRKVADECECIATSYWDTGSLLFSGAVPVNSGSLDAAFVVPGNIPSSIPADTQYTKNSKIYLYAWSDSDDAYGSVDSIPLSQTAVATGDTSPPSISILHMGSMLEGGEEIPEGAPLSVTLSDPSGINLTGAPGFQILAEVDEGNTSRADISESFKYDVGSHTTGSMEFSIPEMPSGPHMITFRATDNALNTVRDGVNLNIVQESVLAIDNALLYPNPFASACDITFDLSSSAMVTVKIFSTGGRLIKTLKHGGSAGFNSINWDGTDHKGDRIANGAYLVKVIASSIASQGNEGRDEAMLKALLVK